MLTILRGVHFGFSCQAEDGRKNVCEREKRVCWFFFSLFCLHSLFAYRIFSPISYAILPVGLLKLVKLMRLNKSISRSQKQNERLLTRSLTARHTQQFVRILHLKIESCDGDGDGMRPRIFMLNHNFCA